MNSAEAQIKELAAAIDMFLNRCVNHAVEKAALAEKVDAQTKELETLRTKIKELESPPERVRKQPQPTE